MSLELLIRQVALSLLFKNIHGKLFGDGIIRLSPLDKLAQKLFIFVLEHEKFGNQITLSLKEKHWLFEIKRLHDSCEHLLIVSWVYSLSIVEEVFLEEDTGDLGYLWLFRSHVAYEKLEQAAWVGSSLVIELGLGSLSVCVVGTKNVLEEVLLVHLVFKF